MQGLTKLEYFAVHLAAGWLASFGPEGAFPKGKHAEQFIDDIFDMAAAMLKESEK